MLRRIRGLLGLAVSWGVAWIPLGLCIYLLVEGVLFGRAIHWNEMPSMAMRFGIVGGLCGFAFGLLIALLEHRRTFDGLTLGRTALWGALGGCAFPFAVVSTTTITAGGTEAIVFGVFSALGALTSLGTLTLARRAPKLAESGSLEELSSGSDLNGLPARRENKGPT